MQYQRTWPSLKTSLTALTAVLALVACSANKNQNVQSQDKDKPSLEAKDSGDASKDSKDNGKDSPDKPAPISGSYLTCVVTTPAATDNTLYAGCQVRDKAGKKIDNSKSNAKWTYTPPSSNGAQLTGSGLSLSVAVLPSNYYFNAVYAIQIPPGGRDAALAYLNASSPIYLPKSSLLSQANASRSLALSAVGTLKFGEMNDIARQDKTFPTQVMQGSGVFDSPDLSTQGPSPKFDYVAEATPEEASEASVAYAPEEAASEEASGVTELPPVQEEQALRLTQPKP